MKLKDLFTDNNKNGLPFIFVADVDQCKSNGDALHTFSVFSNSPTNIVIRDNIDGKKYNYGLENNAVKAEIVEIGE